MGRILIVGAGQSGLQLALGLQSQGIDATLVTNRTAAEIRTGRVLSTQAMFHTALQIERDLGLDHWGGDAPAITGLGLSVAAPPEAHVPPGAPGIDFLGRLDRPAQSVDQRVKMAGWLELFEQRGGTVIVQNATVEDVDRLSAGYDLTVVAAGRGALARLFEPDRERSPFDAPQRAIAVAYVHGGGPRDPQYPAPAIRCNLAPGAGELFAIPALTRSGPCDILFLEAVPGGPLDIFAGLDDPQKFLDRMLEAVRMHVPWEYERFRGAELTDAGGVLAGRLTPGVRHPVGVLPSGRTVLGAADAVVTNDPITGQGANSAARCGAHYLHAILQRGGRPFDADWMRTVFDRYWEQARHTVRWTNGMLGAPPEHVVRLFRAAEQLEPVADRIANAFDDPSDFQDFWYGAAAADEYVAKVRASLGISSAR